MPRAILGLIDLTAIETNVTGVTVKVPGAEWMPPIAAVILLVPAATDVARPLEPAALLIVATEVVADAQGLTGGGPYGRYDRVGRTPGDLSCHVRMAVIAINSRGRQLRGSIRSEARVGRCDLDRLQGRGCGTSTATAATATQGQ